MPKTPSLTLQKVIKLLESKGFLLDRSKGSHQIFIHPETRKRVLVPFHRKDLPIWNIAGDFAAGRDKQRRNSVGRD